MTRRAICLGATGWNRSTDGCGCKHHADVELACAGGAKLLAPGQMLLGESDAFCIGQLLQAAPERAFQAI